MSIEDASRCVEGSIELYIELYIEDVEARAQIHPLREPPHPCSGWLASLSLSQPLSRLVRI